MSNSYYLILGIISVLGGTILALAGRKQFKIQEKEHKYFNYKTAIRSILFGRVDSKWESFIWIVVGIGGIFGGLVSITKGILQILK
jgi:hypothetical protein